MNAVFSERQSKYAGISLGYVFLHFVFEAELFGFLLREAFALREEQFFKLLLFCFGDVHVSRISNRVGFASGIFVIVKTFMIDA